MAVVDASLLGARDMPSIRRRQDYAYWLKLFDLNSHIRCVSVLDPLGVYEKGRQSLSSSPIQNLLANYNMFRSEAGFGPIKSIVCVSANVLVRVLRAA